MRTILVSKYQIIINVAVSCKLLMLSTDRSEKKKKNCWLPNRRLKRFWISTDRKSRKKNKRKRKRRTFVKAKSHGLHSPKGCGSWLLFCFSTSVLSTMGKFYSTVLLETIENRVAIIGRWCSKGIGDASPTSKFAKIVPKGKSRKWVNLYRFTLLANLCLVYLIIWSFSVNSECHYSIITLLRSLGVLVHINTRLGLYFHS